jgi:uncharacterized protein YbjT (DUF2867 family)
MNVLIVGGTGKVGSQTVKALLRRGVHVRVMTRSVENFAKLPKGATGVLGDLEKPETLRAAFQGAEGAFLMAPLAQNETEQGLGAVEAARAAGAKRIVYMSVWLPEGSAHIPHFKSKIPVEQAVQKSGLAWTILRPNNFFQNDFWFQDSITKHGIYPQPIGSKGISRVDTRDIADAAANALIEAGHESKIYGLNGAEVLTGEDVARVFARNLGREVRYADDDLDAWEKASRAATPDWLLHDIRMMYQFFQDHGFHASAADLAEQRKVVGHDPRKFDAFVVEIAPAWKGVQASHA